MLAAGAASLLAATAPAATAVAPQARFQQEQRSFLGGGGEIPRLVALYRLSELSLQLPDQSEILASLEQMARAPGVGPLLRAEVEAQIAAQELRQGQATEAAAVWRRLGVVERWRAVGPFDNSTPDTITQQDGPEKGIDFAASYAGKERTVRWRLLPFSAARGVDDLAADFTPAESASVYLVTWVRSATSQAVALRLIDSGATRVWVNGHLCFAETGRHRAGGFDMHAVGAHLTAGWNEILAKVGATESDSWRFSLRITTPQGEPLALPADTDFHPPMAQAITTAPVAVADLTAEAQKAANTAAGAWNYAWVLAKKGDYNAGDHAADSAFQAAAALAAGDPAIEAQVWLDAAEHQSDETRRFRDLQQALTLAPNDPLALCDRGFDELSRHEFWPARGDFERAQAQVRAPADLPQAWLGLAATYAGFGLPPQTIRYAEQLRAAGYDHAPAIALTLADTLARTGADAPALSWAQAAVASDRGSPRAALQLAALQRNAGDFDAALATLQAAATLAPESPPLWAALARALAGAGQRTEAMAAIHDAVTLDPDNPAWRIAAGDLEEGFGQRLAAQADWREALALDPANAEIGDRLRLARGGAEEAATGFEQPYQLDFAKTVAAYANARDSEGQSGPLLLLADSTVVQIFSSGNVGRYVQQIFRVNNQVGAQQLATYAVTYDPANQMVQYLAADVRHPDGSVAEAPEAEDVPVSQSVGYETFYDVRDKYVRMPNIQPGDFVDIAYRIMPTTLESLYGNYYGDLVPFQDEVARRFQQFVVISPASLPLYFDAVRFHGQQSVQTQGSEKVYRWTMHNEPALITEPDAPPEIEETPYVAISCFENWDQFAAWYRGLIQDTFVMDDDLRQTTDQLIRGLTTPDQKVDAIYDYVIRNTHYIALEFGIHGYRPYPVSQVFHRRFGDCKDKASLLIAMLARARIPADLVLVRTRDLGLVDPRIPSVADFDHAIVYVPSLRLYLDGTAEYNGARELPADDQRAFVFPIPVLAAAPGGSADPQAHLAPLVTPALPSAANTSNRTLAGHLDAQGTLDFTANWLVQGEDAPPLRAALQIPERQAGALQAILRGNLPGISVYTADVRNDDHWNEPIAMTFQGRIPGFASVDGAGGTLLIPREMVATQYLPRFAPLAARNDPVLLEPPRNITETMRLTLPPGYTAAIPPALHEHAAFARVDATARLEEGNVLVTQTTVDLVQSLIPASEYGEFRAFWARVDQNLGRPIQAVKP